MSIDEREWKVLEYLEGELSEEEEKAFLAEVASDPELAVLLEEYQQQDRVLHAWYDSNEAVVSRSPRPDLEALPSAQVEGAMRRRRTVTSVWALAAAILLAGVLGVFFASRQPAPSGVESLVYAEGRAQAFVRDQQAPVIIEKSLPQEVAALKTPAGSQMEATFRGGLGSFEMKENSTVSVAQKGGSVDLDLTRGEVLVFARKPVDLEEAGQVRVQTPYFSVNSERGTFNVVRGMRGAEVAVVSGTVELQTEGARRKLGRGQSYSSTGSRTMPLASRVDWSRHSTQLLAQIPEEPAAAVVASAEPADATPATVVKDSTVLAAATAEESTEETGGLEAAAVRRTALLPAGTSRFLPPDTLSVIEIPSVETMLRGSGKDNFGELLYGGEVREYLESSAATAYTAPDDMEEVEEFLDRFFANDKISLVLTSLGGSISLGITRNGPVLIADVTDNYPQVSQLINQELEASVQEKFGDRDDGRLWFAVENGRLVFAAGKEQFEATRDALRYAQETEFVSTPFFQELRSSVPGSYFTVALDAKSLSQTVIGAEARARYNHDASQLFHNLGLANMQTLIAATSFNDQAENQALRITFDGEREGLMSWLDKPGPLSTFQFFSADTHALVAMRVKTPAVVLDEFFGWIGQEGGAVPDTDPEVALVRQIAATLGNEVAIGLDNPVLPTPNVKVVMEAIDPVGFHDSMIDLLDLMWAENSDLQKVTVTAEDYRDHMIVDFTYPGSKLGISYAIIDDYVVIGPGRASLQDAVNMYLEGQSLANEYKFQQALPAKSGSYCSGLLYAAANASMGEAAPLLTEVMKNYRIPLNPELLVKHSDGEAQAGVYYVIAEDNRIDLYIEGIRGDYAMSGLIPAVAKWIENGGSE